MTSARPNPLGVLIGGVMRVDAMSLSLSPFNHCAFQISKPLLKRGKIVLLRCIEKVIYILTLKCRAEIIAKEYC